MYSTKTLLTLSIFSGLLLAFGWPPLPLTPLIFVGFVPLLFIENIIFSNNKTTSNFQLFKYSYLVFLIWNAITTWWICNASLPAGIFAICANALLMCFPILLFHQTKKHFGEAIGYASFIILWLGFEYLHHEWELTWAWLTLGNGLSMFPQGIQWFQITGALGGSLWVLGVNLFLFFQIKGLWKAMAEKKFPAVEIARSTIGDLVLIIFPIIISVFVFSKYEEKSEKQVDVVIVQPNIDPYNEKFNAMTEERQLEKLLKLSASAVDSNTDYLVWPETAFWTQINTDAIENDEAIRKIRSFLKNFPQLILISGIDAVKEYAPGEKLSATARRYGNGECCWDAYNSAMQIADGQKFFIYHKSKLVPGVERMPYPSLFKFLEPLAINLGGTFGSLGTQEYRTVFFSPDSIGIAPVICFESIFADYLTEYVRNGAQAFFVMTNDGWWKDTPGYKQHLLYGRLAAIENRRDIARSANTGVSCFINQRGEILQATEFWKDAVIKGKINLNSEKTFFSKYGDFIGRGAGFFSVLLILISFISRMTKKFKHRVTRL